MVVKSISFPTYLEDITDTSEPWGIKIFFWESGRSAPLTIPRPSASKIMIASLIEDSSIIFLCGSVDKVLNLWRLAHRLFQKNWETD